MNRASDRARKLLPFAFVVALYMAMGLWVRWHRMGPDWMHFLTASRILAYGRALTLPNGVAVHLDGRTYLAHDGDLLDPAGGCPDLPDGAVLAIGGREFRLRDGVLHDVGGAGLSVPDGTPLQVAGRRCVTYSGRLIDLVRARTSPAVRASLRRTQVYALRARTRFRQNIVLPHGPIAVGMMAPFAAFCDAVGAGSRYAMISILPWLPFLLFDVLAAIELAGAVRRLRPELGGRAQLFLFTLYLAGWATFFMSPYHAHFESVLIFLILVAVRMQARGRDVLAGALLGLAYLTKPTAALAILVQCAILLFSRQGRRAVVTAAVSVGVAAAVLAPFLIGDGRNVMYMIFRAPQELPIAYMTIWSALPRSAVVTDLIVRLANPAALAVAVMLAGWFAWRRRIQLGSAGNYGLLALVTVAALSLVKWGSLHYYLLPFVLLLIWEMAAQQFPWLSITYIGVLSNIFILWLSFETDPRLSADVRPPGTVFGWQSAWLMIVLFAGTLIYLGLRLGRRAALGGSRDDAA